jgi:hypothetical protein
MDETLTIACDSRNDAQRRRFSDRDAQEQNSR